MRVRRRRRSEADASSLRRLGDLFELLQALGDGCAVPVQGVTRTGTSSRNSASATRGSRRHSTAEPIRPTPTRRRSPNPRASPRDPTPSVRTARRGHGRAATARRPGGRSGGPIPRPHGEGVDVAASLKFAQPFGEVFVLPGLPGVRPDPQFDSPPRGGRAPRLRRRVGVSPGVFFSRSTTYVGISRRFGNLLGSGYLFRKGSPAAGVRRPSSRVRGL